ncbi:hypothetical protein GCM10007047_22470 [Cerasicoccus arenae]|uniref:Uncharacterized protein n=2 Tax=Cerasicoccus arenae TaxID=424488 RepID=A0A8J3GEN1_9BACT|nr:hypothetical protein GCM10007047_22470 [Cerasicoccus arenae]
MYYSLVIVVMALLFTSPSADAVSYPELNEENFPSASYDDGNATVLKYRYFVPVNYDAGDTSTLYPLVLFLHGNGEKGTNNHSQMRNNANGAMIFVSSDSPDNQTDFPCFWVAPQCQLADWGDSYLPAQIEGMLDDLIANYHIDPDRIYITGLSMGGGGVISQIDAYPGRYAAANPNCGWATSGSANAYADIPLWAFHCADDGTVGVNGSDQIANQVRSAGGTAIYTRYNTGGHSGAWSRAYNAATPLVPWMMSQRRGQEPFSLVGPYLKITSPTTSGNVSTSSDSLDLGGVADADTTVIRYRNNQFFNEPPPIISGTASWTVTATPLRSGQINPIYLEADTIAYASPGNGKTTTNAYIYINRVTGGDAVQPVVTITSPTSSATYATTASTVSIAGSASDNVGVTSLTWGNNRGGSGVIANVASWQVDDIPLQAGANVITITALDAANNIAMDTITVTLSTNLIPQVNAGADDEAALVAGTAEVLLEGIVSDDGLPLDGELTMQWTVISGPDVVTFADASQAETTASFAATGSYVLRLTADDSEETNFDEVTIVIHPEGTPIGIKYPTVNATNFPSGSYDNGNPTTLNYRYLIPENYDANDSETLYPLVLFLHGAGEKGTDNSKQLGNNANGAMVFISTANPDNQEDFPCFWVAPQCQLSDWGASYLPGQIQGMLDDLIANYRIDPDRIYITGLSMGGQGAVVQLNNYPDRYAAANSNAGSVPSATANNYAHIPMWAFHCADDGTIGINGSDQIANQMRAAGGTPIYTRYDTGGHSGSWTRAYSTGTPLVPWMMAQRRGQEPVSLVGPYVKVISPTTNGSTATSASSLLLSGVADADTTAIRYRNSQFFNDPPPLVNGTASWSVTATPLRGGTINQIYLEADTIAYSAPGNGKTTTNDWLNISTIRYDVWSVDNGLVIGSNSELNDDTDGDSLINLLEYAFGLNPTGGYEADLSPENPLFANSGLPKLDWGIDGSLQFVFPRRVDYAAAQLTYTVQYSSDMQTWMDSSVAPTVIYTDGDIQVVEIADPLFLEDDAGSHFLRISVTADN